MKIPQYNWGEGVGGQKSDIFIVHTTQSLRLWGYVKKAKEITISKKVYQKKHSMFKIQ